MIYKRKKKKQKKKKKRVMYIVLGLTYLKSLMINQMRIVINMQVKFGKEIKQLFETIPKVGRASLKIIP
jgi:hypothetical protein